jgi:four helix bundle protein
LRIANRQSLKFSAAHSTARSQSLDVVVIRERRASCLTIGMKQTDLKERTMRFALDVTGLCKRLQNDWPERRVSDQLFRSATSVAANYHAASRARSRREFQSKLGIVAEEAEETVFWLEFIRRAGMATDHMTSGLCGEAREILAIFIASLKTVAASLDSVRR